MEPITYTNLDLEFESVEGSPATYRVEVVNHAASQKADITFTLPFSDQDLEIIVLKLNQSSRGVRSLNTPEATEARTFGSRLFEAIFNNTTRDILISTLDEADRQGQGVRLRLRLAQTPELINIPWEFLYNPSSRRFFTLSDRTPLIRYLDLPERMRNLSVELPLRILVVIANPRGVPPLDVEREWNNLNTALAPLIETQQVLITRLERATLANLRQELRRTPYHVLHFVGHGDFDEQSGNGVLLLEDDEGYKRAINGPDLGILLYDFQSLRLVVLNVCEGGRTSRNDPFAGTAQSLVQQGIPAVIAMQFPITDDAAIIFSREFYQTLAENGLVDRALAHTRQEVFAGEYGVEWGTPVLYLRTSDGRIFDVNRAVNTTAAAPPPAVQAPDSGRTPGAAAEPVALPPNIPLPPPPAATAAEAQSAQTSNNTAPVSPPASGSTPTQPVSVTVPAPPLPGTSSTASPATFTVTANTAPPPEPTFKLSTVVVMVIVSIMIALTACVVISMIIAPLAPNPALEPTSLRITIAPTIPATSEPEPTTAPTPIPIAIATPTMVPVTLTPTPAIGVEELALWSELRKPIDLGFVPFAVDVSPDGRRVAVGSGEGELVLFEIGSGERIYSRSAHGSSIWTLQFSPGGKLLLSSGTDGVAKIWRADTGSELIQLQNERAAPFLGGAFSPDGTLVALGTSRGTIKIWRVSDGALIQILGANEGHDAEVRSVAFSPDGRLLVSAAGDSTELQVGKEAILWRLEDNTQIRKLSGHEQGIPAVAFAPDGRTIATGSFDESVRIWDTRTGAALAGYAGHVGGVVDIAYRPDGLLLAALSNNGRLLLWRESDGRLLRSIDLNGIGLDLAFLPDNQAVVIAADNGTLQFWGDKLAP